MEIFGWIGGILLSVCGIPQAYKVFREKHANGMSHLNLWLWLFGELFVLIYVIFGNYSLPLLINYSLNFIVVNVIIYYKYLHKDK